MHDNNLPVDTHRPNPQPVPKGIMQTEAAVAIGGAGAGVAAIIALLVEFGLDLTDGQIAAILGVVAFFAPIVSGIITRRRVFSEASAQVLANESAVTGDATIPKPPASKK